MQQVNELFARVELTEEQLSSARSYSGTCGYMSILTEVCDSETTIGFMFSTSNNRMELMTIVKPSGNAPRAVHLTTTSGEVLESTPSPWADGAFLFQLQSIDQLVGAKFEAS